MRGVTAMGTEQPVKITAGQSQITLSRFTGQHCSPKPDISFLFLILHSFFNSLYLFLGVGLGVRIPGSVLRIPVHENTQGRQGDGPSAYKDCVAGSHWAAMHAL
nr:hypothetical protein [Alcaligenes faecalis]